MLNDVKVKVLLTKLVISTDYTIAQWSTDPENGDKLKKMTHEISKKH